MLHFEVPINTDLVKPDAGRAMASLSASQILSHPKGVVLSLPNTGTF